MNCSDDSLFFVEKYSDDKFHDWNEFVRNSKNGNFLFLRGYMEYHGERFFDESVLVYKGGRIVAVFPCNRKDDVVFSHAGLTYGGVIFGIGSNAPDILNLFESLRCYFSSRGVSKVFYKSIPYIFHKYPAGEDLYALNRVGATIYRRDISSVVELSRRPKFSDSRKNTLRKSIKAGAVVVESVDFNRFHELLSSVLRKFDQKPVHSLEELLLLKSRFPEQIRLFCTILEGDLLAASLVYDFGDVVHTQYMASSEEGRKIGALDYLLAELIEKIFKGKRYFSFGISTEDDGRYLNEGLIRQKEGFGARGVVHDFYEWVL